MGINMTRVECVLDAKTMLGEGPLWDPRDNVLYWVNITAREIHRFDPATGVDEVWSAPEDVGCLAVRRRGGLVVALASGFYFFDPESGSFDHIVDPEPDTPENRFNDGKPDRQGRFWAGTMHNLNAKDSGSLYRLDPDLSWHRMVSGITVSNGLAWSPDGDVMYYADSPAQTVWAWDFDGEDGTISNRRVFIDTTETGGAPDGATVDSDGGYWLALPGAWRVICYSPKGRADRTIDLPVSNPTCTAFGGPDLRTLYITTATFAAPPGTLGDQPLAGGLFAVDIGVQGLPEAHFDG